MLKLKSKNKKLNTAYEIDKILMNNSKQYVDLSIWYIQHYIRLFREIYLYTDYIFHCYIQHKSLFKSMYYITSIALLSRKDNHSPECTDSKQHIGNNKANLIIFFFWQKNSAQFS